MTCCYLCYLLGPVCNNSFILTFQEDICWAWCDGIGFVIIITCIVYVSLLFSYFYNSRILKKRWNQIVIPIQNFISKQTLKIRGKAIRKLICFIPYFVILAIIGSFLALDTSDDRQRLISAGGILVFVIILTVLSKHPKLIDWRQVRKIEKAFLLNASIYCT